MQVSILATMGLLKSYAFWVETCFILHTLYCSIIVSSPDLIRRVYHFQYNASDTESDLRWDWFWIWDRDYVHHCFLPL